jgi:hypothetical protein
MEHMEQLKNEKIKINITSRNLSHFKHIGYNVKIGDTICWNPSKYKGLVYGVIIDFRKNNGLPIVQIDEQFHNKYIGQNAGDPNTYVPKTGFVLVNIKNEPKLLNDELNEYGLKVWVHKTNKNLFLQQSYRWVDDLMLLDETNERQIIDNYKASTYNYKAWRPMTKKEFEFYVMEEY